MHSNLKRTKDKSILGFWHISEAHAEQRNIHMSIRNNVIQYKLYIKGFKNTNNIKTRSYKDSKQQYNAQLKKEC